MLKTIIFLLEFFIFLIAVLIFSLMYGITLTNLSYGDINIPKLYIKYDKNLIVKTKKLIYLDKKNNKELIFSINSSINYKNNKTIIFIDNLIFKNLGLKLKGNIRLSSNDINKFINNNKKSIILNRFEFTFDKNLHPLKANKIFIHKNKNNIVFNFEKPTYNQIDLTGTIIKLENINKDINLNIDLKTNSQYNKTIKNVLKYYDVKLPITQYNGINKTNFKLDYKFKTSKINIKLNSKIINAKLSFIDKLMESKYIEIIYENNIIKVTANSTNIKYKDYNLSADIINLEFKKDILSIKLMNGNIPYLKYYINYDKVNLKYYNGELNIYINNMYENKNNIYIKDTKISSITNNINIESKILSNDFNLSLKSIYNLDNNTSNGNIIINKLKIKDLLSVKDKNFDFEYEKIDDIENIRIKKYSLFYTKYGKSKHILQINKFSPILRKVTFLDSISMNSDIRIQTNNDFNSTQIYLSNSEFNIISEKFDLFNNKKSKYTYLPRIDIDIYNSKIAYDKRYIYIKNANLNILNNKIDINIIPQNEDTVLHINKIGKHIQAHANGVSAGFINRIIKKSRFKDGNMDIVIDATPRDVNGQVYFHKIIVKDVSVINNLITFVNTTPAYFNPVLALPTLFHLGETNFSTNGYLIKKGNANFSYNISNKLLKVSSLYTKGTMADFKGNIKIDFLHNKLNSQMKVIFLKDYSRVISHIPILGYIIVGKDGNFETTVDIDGTLEKQTFKTHLVKNTTGGIFNVIKRTISIPLLPFIKKEDMP